jgi:jasmonate O-methyltransferase
MKPLIEVAIIHLCSSNNTSFPGTMLITDLGGSSGPNALALVSTAIQAIHSHYLDFQLPPSEVCVLLSDLLGNDFNMVVKILVTLRQSNKHVAVTGVILGSLYGRRFSSDSLHLCLSNRLALKGASLMLLDGLIH